MSETRRRSLFAQDDENPIYFLELKDEFHKISKSLDDFLSKACIMKELKCHTIILPNDKQEFLTSIAVPEDYTQQATEFMDTFIINSKLISVLEIGISKLPTDLQ